MPRFWKVLINAANDQLSKAKLVGCFFHWKQAVCRCVLSLGTSKDQESNHVTKNVMDILTTTPKDEIAKKGMPCAKYAIDYMGLTSEHRKKWSEFWTHFSMFWLSSSFFIGLWNICDNNDDENEINCRVKDGLERHGVNWKLILL